MLDNRNLRELIRRWRATPQSTVALFAEADAAIRATLATKERVLYPAVRKADEQRAGHVDAAIAQGRRIEAFLDSATRLGPEGAGFHDEAQDAASAMDGLLLHEQRDLRPALDHLTEDEQNRLDRDYEIAWVEESTRAAARHRA
ncbi:hypothetical protein B4N89_33250 [Embleya scabrispora]|uniref:Hemerythrin-like domain-containing protein n=1 Tax=Embleya scabrispora TaxID=159449 RepID=A0A1T3NQG6_9ACTN|nr:hypothetical protein [Embleya scabrispora]OPC78980.1 hypothetical protein B4N89_33250 [Embleya scabrispora]